MTRPLWLGLSPYSRAGCGHCTSISPSVLAPDVQDLCSGQGEVAVVAGDNREVVFESGGGEEGIDDG